MIIHFSPSFDEGVYPLPEDMELNTNERYAGATGLLNLLERELGLTGVYCDNDERNLLYKKALKNHLTTHPTVFYNQSFEQDELAVAERLLAWRDELIFAGVKKLTPPMPMPYRLATIMAVEKDFEKNGLQCFGVADRWQQVMKFLPGAELLVNKVVLHDKQSLLHPFFHNLFNELSANVKIEEQLFEVVPTGSSNLQKLQKALLNGEGGVTLQSLHDDRSLIFLHVKDNYVAGDFLADQIKNGYKALFFNDDNAVFDSCLAASGLAASGSVNYNATPQIIQLFKLVSTGLFAPLDVRNLLSYLQLPYLPFPRYLSSGLSALLAELPGINNDKWNKFIATYLQNDDEQIVKNRRRTLDTFLTFNSEDKNTIHNIRNRYRALKKWADQYPHLEHNKVKDEEKEQFAYLGQLCRNLLGELNDMPDDEEITEARFSRMIETIYKPASFRYFQKQKESPTVFRSPGVITQQTPHVCWINWQNGRQTGYPLAFLNSEEWAYLSSNGCMLYLPENLDQLRYSDMLKGVLAASKQLLIVIPEMVSGQAAVPHALAGDVDAAIGNIDDVIIDQSQLEECSQYLSGTIKLINKKKRNLPEANAYIEGVDSLKIYHTRKKESPSSIEKMIQHPIDWVAEYMAKISGSGTISLPDLFIQKGVVSHGGVEQIMNELKENPEASFDDEKIRKIFYQSVNQRGLEFQLPENRFELHETEVQFIKSVKVLMNIIRANQLKVEGAEISKEGVVNGIGELWGFLDLLLTDKHGNPVVFDLKWTFKSKKYAAKIEEEKDIQLILYRGLLQMESDKDVKTGFFLLNDGKLYTRYDFNGEGVVKVGGVSTNSEMLQRIINSITYRRHEFSRGCVEMGEEEPASKLDYFKATGESNLIPLETDSSNNKKKNYYSNLDLFKGKIR